MAIPVPDRANIVCGKVKPLPILKGFLVVAWDEKKAGSKEPAY